MAKFAKVKVKKVERVSLEYELTPEPDGIIKRTRVVIEPEFHSEDYPRSLEHLARKLPFTVRTLKGRKVSRVLVDAPDDGLIGLRNYHFGEEDVFVDGNQLPNPEVGLVPFGESGVSFVKFKGMPEIYTDATIKDDVIACSLIPSNNTIGNIIRNVVLVKAEDLFLTVQDTQTGEVLASYNASGGNILNPSRPIFTEEGVFMTFTKETPYGGAVPELVHLTPGGEKSLKIDDRKLIGVDNPIYLNGKVFLPLLNIEIKREIGMWQVSNYCCTGMGVFDLERGTSDVVDFGLEVPHHYFFGVRTDKRNAFFLLNHENSYVVVRANEKEVSVYDQFEGPNTDKAEFGDILREREGLGGLSAKILESFFEENSIRGATKVGSDRDVCMLC